MNAPIDIRREAAQVALVRGLERAGWSLLNCEIDMGSETARIEIRRDDMLVTFDARNGKASTTREMVRKTAVRTGRRGDSFLAERIRTEFIGRTKHDGARSGLRFLCGYIADNSVVALPSSSVRALVAPLMGVAS